jgi:hypothetical protein
MVRDALVIILAQGLIFFILLLWGVRSFGAFTSALIRTHDANKRIHESQDYLTEELFKVSRQLRRVSDQQHHPSEQEKSA